MSLTILITATHHKLEQEVLEGSAACEPEEADVSTVLLSPRLIPASREAING